MDYILCAYFNFLVKRTLVHFAFSLYSVDSIVKCTLVHIITEKSLFCEWLDELVVNLTRVFFDTSQIIKWLLVINKIMRTSHDCFYFILFFSLVGIDADYCRLCYIADFVCDTNICVCKMKVAYLHSRNTFSIKSVDRCTVMKSVCLCAFTQFILSFPQKLQQQLQCKRYESKPILSKNLSNTYFSWFMTICNVCSIKCEIVFHSFWLWRVSSVRWFMRNLI